MLYLTIDELIVALVRIVPAESYKVNDVEADDNKTVVNVPLFIKDGHPPNMLFGEVVSTV